MTPTTPPALTAYRTRHTVKPVRDWQDDFRTFVNVCERDGIRVHPLRNGTYRHDASEVAQLAAFERGERLDWSVR